MRTFVIDAFNLIHSIGNMCDSPTPHADLLHYIDAHRLTGSPNNRAVIVFDGFEPSNQLLASPYSILFSDDDTADEVIKRWIERAEHRATVVVVSDDREISLCARGEGAIAMGTKAFLELGKRPTSAPGSAESELSLDSAARERITRELESIWNNKEKA